MKFLKNLKQEKRQERGKLLQKIMKTNSMTQIVCWPCLMMAKYLLFDWANIKNCHVWHFMHSFYNPFRLYVGFNSLVIAVSRYLFIVHDEKVSSYGFGKTKNMLYFGSFLFPLFIAVLGEATTEIPDSWYNIGSDRHEIECQFEKVGYHNKSNDPFPENITPTFYHSPIYDLAQNHLPMWTIDLLAAFFKLTAFIIFSNIVEGILYMHTFIYIKR